MKTSFWLRPRWPGPCARHPWHSREVGIHGIIPVLVGGASCMPPRWMDREPCPYPTGHPEAISCKFPTPNHYATCVCLCPHQSPKPCVATCRLCGRSCIVDGHAAEQWPGALGGGSSRVPSTRRNLTVFRLLSCLQSTMSSKLQIRRHIYMDVLVLWTSFLGRAFSVPKCTLGFLGAMSKEASLGRDGAQHN